jgi:hypothetical protein
MKFRELLNEECKCALSTEEIVEFLAGEYKNLQKESSELYDGIRTWASENDGRYKYKTAKPGKKLLNKVDADFRRSRYFPF